MESNKNLKLNDIFSMVKNFFKFYNSFKKTNIISFACSILLCLLVYIIEKPKYEASSSFVLMEGSSTKSGSLANIGSQFGIDLGSMGGNSNSIFSGDNIFDIFKSRSIIEKVLLSPYEKNTKNEFTIADQYLKMYPTLLKGSKLYNTNSNAIFNNYTINSDRSKDSILKKIYEKIVINDLTIQKLNKKGSIIQVKVITRDENFSKVFNEKVIDAVKFFYLNINNTNTQQVLLGLQNKADSLQNLLYQKSFESAGLLHSNNGIRTFSASEEKLSRDKTVAYALYSEVIKNIEITKMTQAQQTPIFQIVDFPRFPLENKKFSLIELLKISLLLGIVSTVLHAFIKYLLI